MPRPTASPQQQQQPASRPRVNRRELQALTAKIHQAAQDDDVEALVLLLSNAGPSRVPSASPAAVSKATYGGKTPLHTAAAGGAAKVLAHLLRQKGVRINATDTESRWTALHYAAYCGQLHAYVLLAEAGANPDLRDAEGKTARQLLSLDLAEHFRDGSRTPACARLEQYKSGLYVWGSNANYALGVKDSGERFQKARYLVRITARVDVGVNHKVATAKYHTLFVSQDGRVSTCGFGRGGRLGLGDEEPRLVVTPVQELRDVMVKAVAAGKDHSVFLALNGRVYVSGSNKHGQLGIPAIKESRRPVLLKALRDVVFDGVAASCSHTVLYNKHAVFTFGKDHGQLGYSAATDEEARQMTPRRVPAVQHGKCLVAGVSAARNVTACLTSTGGVILFSEGGTRLLQQPIGLLPAFVRKREQNRQQPARIRFSQVAAATCPSGHVLAAVGADRRLYAGTELMLAPVEFASGFRLEISRVQAAISRTEEVLLFLVASTAECYTVQTTLQALSKGQRLRPKKMPGIENVRSVVVSPKGYHAVCIRRCDRYDPEMSSVAQQRAAAELVSTMRRDMGFLLDNAAELHADAWLFTSDGHEVPAHRAVLASRSSKLAGELALGHPHVRVEVERAALAHLLRWAYTGCGILDSNETLSSEQAASVAAAALALGFVDIHTAFLVQLEQQNQGASDDECDGSECGRLPSSEPPCLPFARSTLSFADAQLIFESEDATGETGALPCHKCLLSARCGYFQTALMTRWSQDEEDEADEALNLPVPATREITEALLAYVYEDTVPGLADLHLADVADCLMVANAALIDGLASLCEKEMARRLHCGNLVQVCELAFSFELPELSRHCALFAVRNLEMLAETSVLAELPPIVLEELTQLYRAEVLAGGPNRRIVVSHPRPLSFPPPPSKRRWTPSPPATSAKGQPTVKRADVAVSVDEDLSLLIGGGGSSETETSEEEEEETSEGSESEQQPLRVLDPGATASRAADVPGRARATCWNPAAATAHSGGGSSLQDIMRKEASRSLGAGSTPRLGMAQWATGPLGVSPSPKSASLRDIMSQEAQSSKPPHNKRPQPQQQPQQRPTATLPGRSPTPSTIPSHWVVKGGGGKLSQKQRKALAREAQRASKARAALTPSIDASARNTGLAAAPWKQSPVGRSLSFRDIQLQEEQTQLQRSKSSPVPVSRPVWGPQSPPAAWSGGVGSPSPRRESFESILQSQARAKEKHQRDLNKPFQLIQIEEEAIKGLKSLYRAEEFEDEVVTILRA